MTCHQFKRNITPAVDGRLKDAERLSFERHARVCNECREQYELEAAVKLTVHRHIPHAKAPQGLRDSIRRQIWGINGEHRLGGTAASRLQAFIELPFLKPLSLIILASAAIFAIVMMQYHGGDDGEKNLLLHSLLTHHELERGELAPQVASSDVDRVQGYLDKQTHIPIIVPSLADFALVGGLADTFNGVRIAHLVYRNHDTMLSIAEMPLEDVLRGRGLALSLHVRTELLHTGWYSDSSDNGDAIVLWTRGTTLCAAVARMNSATLQNVLSRLEGNSPTETPW